VRIDVVTLFPEMIRDFCRYGIPRIALERGLLVLGTGASAVARRHQKQSDILAGLLMIYMAAELALKAWRHIG